MLIFPFFEEEVAFEPDLDDWFRQTYSDWERTTVQVKGIQWLKGQ